MQIGHNFSTPKFGRVILTEKDKKNIIAKGPEYEHAVDNTIIDQEGVDYVHIVNARNYHDVFNPAITFVPNMYHSKYNEYRIDENRKAKTNKTSVVIPYTTFDDFVGRQYGKASYNVESKDVAKKVAKEYNHAKTDIEKTAIFATLANNAEARERNQVGMIIC